MEALVPYLQLNDLERYTHIANANNLLTELSSYELINKDGTITTGTTPADDLFRFLYDDTETDIKQILTNASYCVEAILGILERRGTYVAPALINSCGRDITITEFPSNYHLFVEGGIHAFRCRHGIGNGNITIRLENTTIGINKIVVDAVELPNVLQNGQPIPSNENPFTYEFQVSNNQLVEIYYDPAVAIGSVLNLRIYTSILQEDGTYLYQSEFGELFPTYKQSPFYSRLLKEFFAYVFYHSAIHRNNFTSQVVREGRRESEVAMASRTTVEREYEKRRLRILKSYDVFDNLREFHNGSIIPVPIPAPDDSPVPDLL